MPQYWLLKCEPDVYSIHDLAREGATGWDGVRNYQVRNFMRDTMKSGDLGIFYHSNADPSGAAGVLRIERTGIPDPTQFDPASDYHDPKSPVLHPTWLMCEVAFIEAFPQVVALERLRDNAALAGLHILRRGNRLSITPLTESEFRAIRKMGQAGAPPRPQQARSAPGKRSSKPSGGKAATGGSSPARGTR
jgi:predicted RNA-binding protein with PUA-like domain